nr:MAG TPA: hypothetical protein [Caudoviricetes sp.]
MHFADRTSKFSLVIHTIKTGYLYNIVYFPLFNHTYRKNTLKSSIHAFLF